MNSKVKKPKINIFMPVFNGEAYIAEAIQAVLSQDYINFSLVVLDDGSTDKTKSIVSGFLQDKRVSVSSDLPNKGHTYTRNRALKLAETDYFAFVDADDVVEPNWLSEQATYLDQHPDVAVVGCWVKHVDLKLIPTADGVWDNFEKKDENTCALLKSSPVPMMATLFRKKMVAGVFFSEKYPAAEDYGYWSDLIMEKNCHLANVQKVLVRYRRHSAQTSIAKNSVQIQSHLRVFENIFLKMGMDFTENDIARHAAFVEFFDEEDLTARIDENFNIAFLAWVASWIEQIKKSAPPHIFNEEDLSSFLFKYWRRSCRKSIKNIGIIKSIIIFIKGYISMFLIGRKNIWRGE